MHQAHTVKFNDENGQHYSLVLHTNDDGTKNLLAWLGAENGGWQEKPNVPNGSVEQGYTYST